MLSKVIFVSTVFPYALTVVLCKKDNGKLLDDSEGWRFVIDYRKLNATSLYLQDPLPIIYDFLANITTITATFMSTLDMILGHFQIAIRSEDIEKSAFVTKSNCYAVKRMTFGLLRVLITYQPIIKVILRQVLGSFAYVQLDYIIITLSMFEGHLSHYATSKCCINLKTV